MDAQTKTVKVEAFRSERIIVAIQAGATRHKVFQVFFGRDGSLFVTFPYFRHRAGILAAATIPGNGQTKSEVNLQIGGKIASHLVKYSHHPDGSAHFSQDGKVRTEIKRQSSALDEQWGHIFSVAIQGPQGFARADDGKSVGSPEKRTTLTFQVEGATETASIKFVGRWFDIFKLPLGGQIQRVVGPVLPSQDAGGKQQSGLLVASPYKDARHVLLITCEAIPRLSPEPELMLFYGGFDAREIMDDTTKEAGFLAFLYPASNAEDLKKAIGTIDR